MKLPCSLIFPSEWHSSVQGCTANMHRDGVLISCERRNLRQELPKVGSKANLQVELPANPQFSRKCVICETTLVRVHVLGETEVQFALLIGGVAFRDLAPVAVNLAGALSQPSSSLPV